MAAKFDRYDFSADALQRASVLTGVPKLLAAFGVPVEAIRDGLDVSPLAFEDPDFRLPFATVGRILDRCARLTGCGHFGLLLGAAHDHRILGLPGALMSHSPTLGAALSGFVRLQQMNSQGAAVYLRRFDDAVVIGYGVYDRHAVGHEQFLPLVMAMALNIVRALTGGGARVAELHFSIRPPADPKPYLAHFGVPILFNRRETGVVLPRAMLDAPVIDAKASELERLSRPVAAAQSAAEGARPWSARVRHAMKPLLLRGEPTTAAMAAHLDLSARTLTRRLSEEGARFQILLEEVRFTAARELLLLTDLPIGDIALALSYAAHAPFVEAFRRWAGIPPSAWRAARKSETQEGEALTP